MKPASLELRRQAGAALDRLSALRERALPSQDALVPEVLEELSAVLHELQVTSEDLRDQNEVLLEAEDRIAIERERYRRLFDFGPDGYLVTDIIGVIREANRMAGVLLGRDPSWLVGKPLAVFVPMGHRSRFRATVGRLPAEESVQSLETPLESSGTRFPAILRILPVRTPKKGGATEVWWTIRDVSVQQLAQEALTIEVMERRRSDEALRRSERRYRHLVEHAQELVYEVDAEGRFTFCNTRASEQMLGYSEAELLGRKLTDFVPRKYRRLIRDFLHRAASGKGLEDSMQFPLCTKDSRQIWVEQRALLVEHPDGPAGLSAVCRDIGEQRARIRELEASDEKLRDMTTYLRAQIEAERARIAHDIHDELGAALTAIRMELALSSRSERPRSNDELVGQLDSAIEIVRRVCSDLRPSLLDNIGLCAAIDGLAQDVDRRTALHCEAVMHGLPDEPERDRATAIFRIVQEAVTNAMRHANATTVSIVQRCEGSDLVLDVVDDGRGIRTAERENPRSFGIVGMHERAKALGGRVRIVGNRQGTRLTLRVPVHRKAEHESAAG